MVVRTRGGRGHGDVPSPQPAVDPPLLPTPATTAPTPAPPAAPRVIPSDDEMDAQERTLPDWRPIIPMPQSPTTAATVANVVNVTNFSHGAANANVAPIATQNPPPAALRVVPNPPLAVPAPPPAPAPTVRLAVAVRPTEVRPVIATTPFTALEATIREIPSIATRAPPAGNSPVHAHRLTRLANQDQSRTHPQLPNLSTTSAAISSEAQSAESADHESTTPVRQPSTEFQHGETSMPSSPTRSPQSTSKPSTPRRSPRLLSRSTSPPLSVVLATDVDAKVETMIEARAKPSYIYNFLLEKGENVTKRDVENRIAKHRKKLSAVDDSESVAEMIAKFAAEDPFNMVSVDETERDHTGVVSFMTATMRATYARFQELVLVDCTHKTNRYNYQLCTFMVVDENGNGRPVQHSLMETNSDWHMMCALRHFSRAHPTSEKEFKVGMVDKDLNEIRVIRVHFPSVELLICTFHVKKYLAHVSRKAVYGRISAEDHEQLDHLLHFCVYAQSQQDYDSRLEDLRAFCKRVNFTAFLAYYMKNWDNCQRMWVEHYRNKLPFFCVNTNNHLESFFGKFKDGLKPEITMTECLSELFAKERTRENELRFSTNRVGMFVNYNYHDTEMKMVLRFTTHFVADNISREYARAKAKAVDYAYDAEDDGNFVQVQGRSSCHRLSTLTWTCACPFATNMKLPCRHAIAYRIHTGMTPVIPMEAVDLTISRTNLYIRKRPNTNFKYKLRQTCKIYTFEGSQIFPLIHFDFTFWKGDVQNDGFA